MGRSGTAGDFVPEQHAHGRMGWSAAPYEGVSHFAQIRRREDAPPAASGSPLTYILAWIIDQRTEGKSAAILQQSEATIQHGLLEVAHRSVVYR